MSNGKSKMADDCLERRQYTEDLMSLLESISLGEWAEIEMLNPISFPSEDTEPVRCTLNKRFLNEDEIKSR